MAKGSWLTAVATLLMLAEGGIGMAAKEHEPYAGTRIYWDVTSERTMFYGGYYGRIRQLNDGRLMLIASGTNGIVVSYSADKGSTWTEEATLVSNGDQLPITAPDLIQLSNGTIIVAYNPRPSTPYSEERRFGIRTIRSTDNGQTWSSPSFVYDASYLFDDGCWEPYLLELPSGEVQCYFSNEGRFTTTSEQEIVVSRSFDQGVTWGDIERVSYRAGSRDGMPAAIITDAGEIVVTIEDNGHPNYSNFHVTTVRCSLDDNWSTWVDANSANRSMIFANESDKPYISAAPYLCRLKNGATVASWQGNHDRPTITDLEYFDMFVAVGDADARNFKAITQPFSVPLTSHADWNSLAVDDDGTLYAISTVAQSLKTSSVHIMKGYAMDGFEANYGTPTIDGSFSKDIWTKKNAQQVYMGVTTRNRATMDFLYDRENLYFFARVVDRTLFTDKVDNDGVFLYLDTKNACDTYPQDGMFKLFLNANGEVDFWSGNNNKWVSGEAPDGLQFVVNAKSSYYDMELAIPWKAMGYDSVPVDNDMRCNIEVRDRRDGELVLESIADTDARQSWTWPEFHLTYDDRASIGEAVADVLVATTVGIHNGNMHIVAGREMTAITVHSAAGLQVAAVKPNIAVADVDVSGFTGVAVVSIVYANGTIEHRKVIVK
jgi:hypothetical protein